MKFKNWLIKKLGGYTIAEYEDLKEDLKDVNIELEKSNADSLALVDASQNFLKESDCYISKLKEVIKILNDKLKLFWFDYKVIKAGNPVVEVTQEEYELINEVVKNVRG